MVKLPRAPCLPAREIQGHVQADKAIEDATTARDAQFTTARDAQLGRLAYDARKWHASKLAPKVYGDKTEVAVTGAAPVQQSVTVSTTGRSAPRIEQARRSLIVDPSTDPQNCGGCGNICPAETPNCFGGSCTNCTEACPACQICDESTGTCIARPQGSVVPGCNGTCYDGVCRSCPASAPFQCMDQNTGRPGVCCDDPGQCTYSGSCCDKRSMCSGGHIVPCPPPSSACCCP
jgi:hypothetical protein